MNELDLIRSFRADVPAPSAAAVGRAGRAWRRPEPRPRWAPRLAVATGLAAAAIAAVVALPGGDDGRLGPANAAAAQTLRHAAAAQNGGLPRPLRVGEFWYVRQRTAWSTVVAEDGYVAIRPQVREDWVAIDGARHTVIRPAVRLRFPTSRDRRRWEASGRPALAEGPSDHNFPAPAKGPFYLGDEAVDYAQLVELPRDAEALYNRLHGAAVACECGHSVDDETFVIVGDLLRDNPIPDDLRAALLRAAALIPGIKLVASDRDVAGREGIAVAYDYDGHRRALVFDRYSYRLLGETERRVASGDGAPGRLLGGSAYVESGIVASDTQRP